jgi:hypothetical protein
MVQRVLVGCVLVGLVGGCGSGRSAAEIDRGRQAVVAALDGWKANTPLTQLRTLPDPVDFADDLRATHALVDYSLGRVDATDPEVIRYTVTLTLRDKKGKFSEREVVYAVALKTPIVVSRDPYY